MRASFRIAARVATGLGVFREAAGDKPAGLIPPEGIVGDVLKEAAKKGDLKGDLFDLIDKVRCALKAAMYPAGGDAYIDMEAIFADAVVVCGEKQKCFSYPYSVDAAGVVTLGTPVEVEEIYQPVKMTEAVHFMEAVEGAQDKFLITVIQSGMSLNRAYYPDAALKEAVPLFNGARVFVKSDAEHLSGAGKDVRNIIGALSDAKFVEGSGTDTGKVQAVLTLLDANDALATKLREAVAKSMTNLFGFSIDLIGKTAKRMVESKPVRYLTKATKVNSVDLIVEPGAGGALVRMVEAADPDNLENPHMERALLIKKIKAKLSADRLAALGDLTKLADDRLLEAYDEATALETAAANAPPPAAGNGGNDATRFNEAVAVAEARFYANTAIDASSLPAASKERLVESFAGQSAFTKADVDAAIKKEGDYVAKLTPTGRVQMGDFGTDIRITEAAFEKVDDMLDAFFDPAHKNHRDVQSFKECYIAMTGDRRVTGLLRDCDRGRLAESLGMFREALDSTSFANVLGNSITRRMLNDYNMASEENAWRQLVSVVPVADFRSQERTRFGGYADLATVGENDPYPDLSSPTDEKATYAVAKRGGIERVSLEMIKNDDAGAIRRLPIKISRAARRTLGKFVFDFIRTNPAAYDAVAWFHATHNNLFATALDATQLAAHRLAMLKQTEKDSVDRIGVAPKFLIVPFDLYETAVNLFNRNTNLDKTFVQSMNMTVVPVWYWTDANDWATMADPGDLPGIEIGFLDGREEPELFIQDAPTVGSLFTNDQISWKVRHTYGGNIVDVRAGTKAVVP